MTQVTGTGKYEQLLERCRSLGAIPTAVAHPCEASALAGPMEAAAKGLIIPILVGPAAKIAEIAKAEGIDLGTTRIIDVPHSHAAAAKAVELVRAGRGRAADEGQPAHRRTAGRGGRPRNGPAHRPPAQSRLHHGRAHLSQGADRHRRAPSTSRPRSRTRRTSARTRSTWRCRWAWRGRRWPSSPRSRPSPRRCRRPSTPPACARWPSAARSRAASSTARWRSTTPSATTRRGSRASPPRSPAIRTSCWRRISKPATSWPSSSPSSRTPTARAWCSARGCRSS